MTSWCNPILFLLLSATTAVRATHPVFTEVTKDGDYDVDTTNRAIESFIRNSIEKYPLWLAQHDPSSLLREEIHLDSKNLLDPISKDVEVFLTITNQYTANHSKYEHAEYINVRSSINNKSLDVSYAVAYQNDYVLFTGEYNASGNLNVLGTKIPFNGQGIWKLRCDALWEPISYTTYTITDSGYIELGSVEDVNHKYYTTFVDFEYEGLQFEYNGEISSEMWISVYSGLSDMYSMYLIGEFETYKNSPPKQLLHTYLTEVFVSTRLEDIVSEWKPTTLKPPISSSINILENVWLLLFSILLIFS